MADRGPGVRAADRLGQSPKVICSRSAPISARNVLEREIRRATSKEPTTAHRSGHSTRDQKVADTASRQLITQRPLVQIRPVQRTTANAPRTTDRSATARAAFSLAIPSKLRSVPCGRRLTLRGSIGRARSPPSVERRPSCREISPVSGRFAVKERRENPRDHEPRHSPGPQCHHDPDKNSVAHAITSLLPIRLMRLEVRKTQPDRRCWLSVAENSARYPPSFYPQTAENAMKCSLRIAKDLVK